MYGYLRMVKEGIPEEMTYGPGPGRGVSKCHTQGRSRAAVLGEKRASVYGQTEWRVGAEGRVGEMKSKVGRNKIIKSP